MTKEAQELNDDTKNSVTSLKSFKIAKDFNENLNTTYGAIVLKNVEILN